MECVYDITLRRSKEELRVELQMLRDRQASHAELLAIVAEPESSDQVLGFLRTGHSIETILSRVKEARTSKESDNSWSDSASPSVSDLALARLRAGLGGETASGSGGNSSGAAHEGSYKDSVEITGLEKTLWPLGAPATAAAPEEWTFLTGDPGLVRHLMALYFCWEYPLFTALSREHFMNDFHHGYHRFCSPLLVNAMLALGSCWDGQPRPQSKFTDLNIHGDQFFQESVRLLGEQEDCRSLSTVQALGLMAMWEISHGRDVEGRYYSAQSLRLAIDMGLHRTVDESDWDLYYVQALTFWGAFSLDSMCYHFAIIQLFHPFLDLQLIGARLSPASICHQAADAIQGLLKSYSQIHTLNRTPVFIPFVAMASAISHLEKRIIAEPATEAYWDTNRGTLGGLSYHALGELDQDISDLRVMSGRHYSAVQAVGFLRSLARERKIELSSEEHSISTKDYDRLARPYLRRISIESGESNVEEAADY
ncbi:fungal specific transcription factor domain-containing protein [Sarocladium implicatum]|nr:fungal specific transcription factor domain-containing protein [Sarocladium implicatum]